MATFGKVNLSNYVLEHLGVKAAGQSASDNDIQKVLRGYTSIYRQLRRRGHAPWSIDAIEEEAIEPLTQFVAGRLATKFGITGNRKMELRDDMMRAHKELVEAARGHKQQLQTRFRDF